MSSASPSSPSSADDVGGSPDTSSRPAGRLTGSGGFRLLIGLAAAVVVVMGMQSFSGTIGTVFLALVVIIVLHPMQGWLQHHRVPGWLAATITMISVYLIILALAAAIALSVAQLVDVIPTYSDQFSSLTDDGVDLLGRFGIERSQITSAVGGVDTSRILSVAQGLLSGVTSGLTDFGLLLLLVFFVALDAGPFPMLLGQARRSHPQVVDALEQFAFGTRRFIVVSTIFGAVVALIDVAILYWLGVPLPWLWGLVAFVTNYIANIGFILGLVPPALLALVAVGPQTALWVVVAYTIVNISIQGLAQPKIVGSAVGLSATLTFLSVVFWGFALGTLGALLAVPLSLLVRAMLVDANPSARWLLPVISGTTRGVRRRRSGAPAVTGPRGGSSIAPPEVHPRAGDAS